MEECLKITFLDKQKILTEQDFLNNNPLFTFEELKEKLNRDIKDLDFQMFNPFIYFILFVEYKLKLPAYETHIRTKISQIYIKNHMHINIYKYAYFANLILNISVHQCMHIIYYLIYGRFASASYVNHLILKKQQSIYSLHKNLSVKINKSFDDFSQKSPKAGADKKISWKGKMQQSDLQMFTKNLNDIMKIKKNTVKIQQEQPIVKQEQTINTQLYEMKLSHIKNKQTSPIINILKHKYEENIQILKPNKKILLNKDNILVNKLNEANQKKANMLLFQKNNKDGGRINLKTVYELKQKIKNQNSFLDELRTTLTTQYEHSKILGRKILERKFEEIQISCNKQNILKEEGELRQQNVSQIQQGRMNYVGECDILNTNEQSEEKGDEDLNFNILPDTNNKISFKNKVFFYKTKYKQFLKSKQKRSLIFS